MNTLFILINHCCRPIPGNMQHPLSEVAIVFIICVTIVIGALLVAIVLPKWHKRQVAQTETLKTLEIQKAENDRKMKMKADFQVKILDHIKENGSKDGFKADDDPYIKKIEQFIKEL